MLLAIGLYVRILCSLWTSSSTSRVSTARFLPLVVSCWVSFMLALAYFTAVVQNRCSKESWRLRFAAGPLPLRGHVRTINKSEIEIRPQICFAPSAPVRLARF